MKKILAGLFALLGLGTSAAAAPGVQTIDPRELFFSLSTISDDGAPVQPLVGHVAPDDVVFHEDDWRQVEFFPPNRLAEIRKTLTALKAFADANRVGIGWRHIYVRKLGVGPVLSGPGALKGLATVLHVVAGPGPVIYTGAKSILGRVADGFSLPLGKGVALYGYSGPAGVAVLGADVRSGGDDRALVRAFTALHAADGLIAVDWRAQMLLISVAADGQIEVWRP